MERDAALAAKTAAAAKAAPAERVERELPVLHRPPLSSEEVDRLGHRVEALRARRDCLDAGIDALEYVRSHVEALGWEDAPRRLVEGQALVPALRAQLDAAEEERRTADAAASEADRRHDQATAAFQDADGLLRVAVQEHAAAAVRFEALGVPAPTEEGLAAAAAEVARLEEELRRHEGRRDELLGARGGLEKELEAAGKRVREAEEKLASERREAEPALKRWEELRERAAARGLIGALLAEMPSELADIRGQVNLMQEAKARREVLLERLKRAQGGEKLLAELQVLRATAEVFGEGELALWLDVRDWLRRRLPAQVAEVDDPREALLRLHDCLGGLEERLARQEGDLRGASEDVARGIDVQIRKARGQVTRLSRNLEGVSFGSIQGIRVRLSIVERMEQVLRALREGAAQSLLFQAEMPIEDALDEISGATAAVAPVDSASSITGSTSISRWRSGERRARSGRTPTRPGSPPEKPSG